MAIDLRVISIGTLAAHPLWGEAEPVRTGHATTTLVRSGKVTLLIDPGLPEAALAARLNERTGLKPRDITHVFLTSFSVETSRGLGAFDHAPWLIAEAEREAVGVPLAHSLRIALEKQDREVIEHLQMQVAILQRCEPAEDELAPQVTPFALPGVTPGMSGVLVADLSKTILVTGDAIPTIEHLEHGRAPTWADDVQKARDSLAEAIEIADLLVLGRDNLVPNRSARPF